MTPGEMLEATGHALAKGRRGRYRLELTAGVVLGEYGTYLGDRPDGTMGDYGYTKRQCKRIRKAILDAARHDLNATSPDLSGYGWEG